LVADVVVVVVGLVVAGEGLGVGLPSPVADKGIKPTTKKQTKTFIIMLSNKRKIVTCKQTNKK
jgi:hypothetical protein